MNSKENKKLFAQQNDNPAAQMKENEGADGGVAHNGAQEDENFLREMMALMERLPEVRERFEKGEGLPGEVIRACAKEQIPLQVAYAEYALREAQKEIQQLRRENEVLRQNAQSATRAPVRSAAQGGANEQRKDPFLEGFFFE